jgi:hypothetical protein
MSRDKVPEDVVEGLSTNSLIAELASEVQYIRPKSLNKAIHIVNQAWHEVCSKRTIKRQLRQQSQ